MSLPREYKGYSTRELLDIFERIPGRGAINEPDEKFAAMRSLMRVYRLAPVLWETQEDEDRAKNLIAELLSDQTLPGDEKKRYQAKEE